MKLHLPKFQKTFSPATLTLRHSFVSCRDLSVLASVGVQAGALKVSLCALLCSHCQCDSTVLGGRGRCFLTQNFVSRVFLFVSNNSLLTFYLHSVHHYITFIILKEPMKSITTPSVDSIYYTSKGLSLKVKFTQCIEMFKKVSMIVT